jgi:3-dehydroquinate synthase
MKSIEIKSERSYEVVFVDSWSKILVETLADRPAVAIFPTSLKEFVVALPASIHRVEVLDGESQKSVESFARVLNQIADLGLPRNGVIIGVGGGATTDLAGFVAASYLRGIDWIAVPTSLAGMVDAAIGGKTGINLMAGKNLAGAFHSPYRVIVDQHFLSSLSERDLRAGMAEVAKCGFIADIEILDLIEKDWRENLSELIFRAVKVKASVVTHDFRESYEREVLNYGHTLGHAIERESNYELRHGEAVSIGLNYAAALSVRQSGLSDQEYRRHIDVLELLGLPTRYPREKWSRILTLMYKDKNKREHLRFVALSELGKPTRLENLEDRELQNVYEEVVGR